MASKTGERYSDFLKDFKEYHEKQPSPDYLYGYTAKKGIVALAEMKPEYYGRALDVFACVDRENKSAKTYSLSRNPSILCAAYLVNDCSLLVGKMEPENVALLAEYLYISNESDFNKSLPVLANDNLLSTINDNIEHSSHRVYACSVIVDHAKKRKIEAKDIGRLVSFWADEIGDIKQNPISYTCTEEAWSDILAHMHEKYPNERR